MLAIVCSESSREPPPVASASGVVCALPLDAPDDAVLVRSIVAGDRRAAAALYMRYAPLVHRLLVRALGPWHEVEDLEQEVFLAVVRQLPRLERPESLRGYVVAVALNLARLALRNKRRRGLVLFGSEPPDTPGGAEPDPDLRRALEKLYLILDDIEEGLRLAFVLRHVEQMEVIELAAALDWSVPTAKRRIARAESIVWARARKVPELAAYVTRREVAHG